MLEVDRSVVDAGEPHGVCRRAPALGRATGIEYLKALGAHFMEWQMRMPKDHCRGIREAPAQSLDPPERSAGVMDHPDPHAADLCFKRRGELSADTRRIDVAVHRMHRRPKTP